MQQALYSPVSVKLHLRDRRMDGRIQTVCPSIRPSVLMCWHQTLSTKKPTEIKSSWRWRGRKTPTYYIKQGSQSSTN